MIDNMNDIDNDDVKTELRMDENPTGPLGAILKMFRGCSNPTREVVELLLRFSYVIGYTDSSLAMCDTFTDMSKEMISMANQFLTEHKVGEDRFVDRLTSLLGISVDEFSRMIEEGRKEASMSNGDPIE